MTGTAGTPGSRPSRPAPAGWPSGRYEDPAAFVRGRGLGQWIAHQVCAHVALEFADGAFTVRLVAGEPVP
ncbi:hypothetical protein GCM10007977_071210 [Dactylosporangium sucinum]|uniref:Uncharacterized protein n=1 Tax=Dactylosporangium sucinum TaxID=1424081 RepID=A0A917U5X7_9ACTN|nr:hypothetical protein GCM10007977_071210 [Dactylosporangium sucinum]